MAVTNNRWPLAPAIAILGLLLAFCIQVHAADNDASILINEIGRASNDSLMWGPYRPNLYFGVRPRLPKSFLGGLMWSKVDNYQDVQNSTFCGYIFLDYFYPALYMVSGVLPKKGLTFGVIRRLQTHLRATRRHGWLWLGRI
jgi:hypothetical protein